LEIQAKQKISDKSQQLQVYLLNLLTVKIMNEPILFLELAAS
jgi:hypothetical protein